VESHLHQPSQPDRSRLTSPHAKMIFTTYKSDAHPSDDLACLNGDMLVILWPGPFLPKGARRAGEDEHAALRSAARSA